MISTIELTLPSHKRGFHLITSIIVEAIKPLPEMGLLNIFLQHTSAALTINENYDPDVRVDMETIINKLIPENLPEITHNIEGSDDMPAHFKSSIFGVSLSIPCLLYTSRRVHWYSRSYSYSSSIANDYNYSNSK